MGLARAWRRRLYASTGLAVVVPAALLVSLALLAAGGGPFDLASLGQVISGPSGPAAQPLALGGGTGGAASGQPGASAAPTSTLLAAAPPPASHRPSSGPGSAHGGGNGSGVANPRDGGGGNGVPNPRNGGGGGSGPPARHLHPPRPTVADRVVNAVTPVTSG